MPEVPGIVVAPHSERPIPAVDVLALYRAQDWWPERTVHQLGEALDTSPAVAAWRDDELVGFARAVTDGVLRAYVEDVIVSPRLRRTGVGAVVLRCLLEQLSSIPVVTLFCSERLVPFYEAAGFRPTAQVVAHRSGIAGVPQIQ